MSAMKTATLLSTLFFFITASAYPVTQDEVLPLPSNLPDEELVNLAERYITAFDISLASRIKPFVVQLNEKQKQQFLKDIGELNEAIEDEILTMLYKKASEGDDEMEDLTALYGEISKDVVNRVVAKYQDRPWLKRLMNFSGNEIEDSI